METVAAADDCLRVFGHLCIQDGYRLILVEVDSIEVASSKATPASYAVGTVHMHFPGCRIIYQATVCAFPLTATASAASGLIDDGLACGMLVLLAGT